MLNFWVSVLLLVPLGYGEQIPIKPEPEDVDSHSDTWRVAIVGAGIAGASAAYLLEDSNQAEVTVDVYEADSQVGGRIKSARPYDGRNSPPHVETGATAFYANDKCMQAAIDSTGLRHKLSPHIPRKKTVGVWDGEQFVLRREGNFKPTSWQNYVRDTLRYGLSPARLIRLVKDQLPRLQRLAGPHETITTNLPAALRVFGLEPAFTESAEEYLLHNSLLAEYINEVVQATTRAWLGFDTDKMNGLGAIVAMNGAETDSLDVSSGGNMILIERLLKLSGADVRLNARVEKLTRMSDGSYDLHFTSNSSGFKTANYDVVIIATPLQGAGLDLEGPMVNDRVNTTTLPSFVERHVTHFTSPMETKLDPAYFKMLAPENVPEVVYTTTSSSATDPEFLYIERSLAAVGLMGCVLQNENMYKVTSATPIEDDMIVSLLGHPANSSLEDIGVRWVHRQAWPYAAPQFDRNSDVALLDDIELVPRVFYTGIADEIVPSLEMSCRLGRLAAKLALYARSGTTEDDASK